MHKYQWLEHRLENLIQQHIREGKNKLPSEQSISERYQVSRQTVRMALNELEKKGLIEKRRGSGSYITGLLAGSHANEIGILISDDQEYIYPGVIHDIQHTLTENGLFGTVYVTGNRVGTEREILLEQLKHPLRGLIIEGSKSAFPNPNLDLYRKLLSKGCELIFLYNYYPGLPDCPFIKDDNLSGSALLTRHLAAQGHTAIAGIFKADDMQGLERYQGFIETLRDLGLPLSDHRICWYTSRELDKLVQEKDTRFLIEIVQKTLSSCTAVVCYNDLLAYHLINVLLHMGYSLPRDIAVAAFDNTYFSNSDILTITTLSHRPHEMGTKAAQAMIRKLKGLPVHAQETRWELTQKESTEATASPHDTPWDYTPEAYGKRS